jgi:hypothetical protein
MKQLLTILLSALCLSTFGQIKSDEPIGLEVSGFYGYRFGGKIDVFYNADLGYLKINDQAAFGAELSYQIRKRFSVNLMWTRQSTDMDFYGYTDVRAESLGDVDVDYFMISGLNDFGAPNSTVSPFGGAGIGIMVATPDREEFDTAYRFAFTLQGGVKIWMSERLGLKLRGAMIAPMQWGSGGLFCNAGSGCSVGVGASTTVLQGEFSGGVVVKL